MNAKSNQVKMRLEKVVLSSGGWGYRHIEVFSGIRDAEEMQITAYLWLRAFVNTHDVYIPSDPVHEPFGHSDTFPADHHIGSPGYVVEVSRI